MSAFTSRVEEAFAPAGLLARMSSTWRLRPGQLDMAQAIAEAVEQQGRLVVEAGTGIGKTYAYLVPALLSGQRALISTVTQALQDQLFARDIPAVTAGLGLPARVAVLKGRSSYVCLHRLQQARSGGAGGAFRDPAQTAALEQIHRWAEASVVGDLAELPGLGERSTLRPVISSTRENCLGSACSRVADCHVNRARREALKADLVVVNHHLFFADRMVRESAIAELLPTVQVVIFDEAHQINETGIGFLAGAVGSAGLRSLARDLALQGPKWAQGMRPWSHLALNLEQAVREVSRCHLPGKDARGGQRQRWLGGVPEGMAPGVWKAARMAVASALLAIHDALTATSGAAVELDQLSGRGEQLLRDWMRLSGAAAVEKPGSGVRWLEWDAARGAAGSAGPSWRLLESPVDCAAWFQALLGSASAQEQSWVFTSATLGSDDALSWFTRPMGLVGVHGLRTMRLPSPFNHTQQAALYIPADLPEPADVAHTPALAQAVARWASRLGGRTLMLTTTLRAASRLAQVLETLVEQGACAELEVLAQGALSKQELLARFRSASGHEGRAAVLVASMSFWEGVDLAGDVLQLLVIDKLPFPPPDDPLIEARARALVAAGQNVFAACYLPEAAMALKQGVGRLIRSESDRGALVIADRRLLTRSYGNRLLAALPPMRRLMDEAELEGELDALVSTRASTTDHRGS